MTVTGRSNKLAGSPKLWGFADSARSAVDQKQTKTDTLAQLAQQSRDLADIERARRDGMLSEKQYEAMRAAILSRTQDTP